jgi:hypothetical protein
MGTIGLINQNKSEEFVRDFFYTGNSKSINTIELLWGNANGKIIEHDDYLKLEIKRSYFANFMNGLVHPVTENCKDISNNGIGIETKGSKEIM